MAKERMIVVRAKGLKERVYPCNKYEYVLHSVHSGVVYITLRQQNQGSHTAFFFNVLSVEIEEREV